MIEYSVQLRQCFCAKHGYTCILKIRNAFKQWRCSQMTADMKNTPAFVEQIDTILYFTA